MPEIGRQRGSLTLKIRRQHEDERTAQLRFEPAAAFVEPHQQLAAGIVPARVALRGLNFNPERGYCAAMCGQFLVVENLSQHFARQIVGRVRYYFDQGRGTRDQ